MKQTKKNYIFNNFSYKLTNGTSKDKLTTNSFKNISFDNEKISSYCPFQNLFDYLFDEEFTNKIKNNNDLSNFLEYFVYEYKESNVFNFRLFAINSNYELFELDKNNFTFNVLNIKFISKPNYFHYNNMLLILDKSENMYIINYNNEISSFAPIPQVDKFTYFDNSILFFTINNNSQYVYCIENTELYSLNNNLEYYNKIKLNETYGSVLDIININEKIYVVQQYAISRLISSNNQYYIRTICYTSKIIENSIYSYNDNIYFLTDSGLNIFNGSNTNNILPELSKKLLFIGNVNPVLFNSKYYAYLFYVNTSQPILLEISLDNLNYNLFDIGKIYNMNIIQTNNYYLFAIKTNTETIIFNDNKTLENIYYVRFNKLLFNTDLLKTINTLFIESTGSFSLTINSNNKSKTFEVNESNKMFPHIGLSGYNFDIEITSDKYFSIESLHFKITEIGDYYD